MFLSTNVHSFLTIQPYCSRTARAPAQAAAGPPVLIIVPVSSESSAVPPKIYDISSDITVNEGSNVSLICTASGKPEPSISWRHITPLGELASPLACLC